jgi:glycerate-2-kinase
MSSNYVRNELSLLRESCAGLRKTAIDLINATFSACDPFTAARNNLHLHGDRLIVGDREYELQLYENIYVIGAGKATTRIAQAIEECLGKRISAGRVIAKHGDHFHLNQIEKSCAAHPLPDAASHAGARDIMNIIDRVRPNDLVISCFTGGSSSLFVAPVDGISLEDKAKTSKALLTCGANIVEINAVRKHISTVKGGRLACMLPKKTRLINPPVSDVIGDSLDYITDPTVPDTSTLDDARAVIRKFGLQSKLPNSVVDYLTSPDATETPKEEEFLERDVHSHILVAGNAAPVAAQRKAEELGFSTLLLSSSFEGESREIGRAFASIAKEIRQTGNPLKAPCCIIGGGETTVRIGSKSGTGGPNQEFALASAQEIADLGDIIVCGVDTDGTDGPTDFAGAMVDSATLRQARDKGLDIASALDSHDVSPLLQKLGCAIETGATGTNVNDLKFMLIR